jgi:hypothetical protein
MKLQEISTTEVDESCLDDDGKVPYIALHCAATEADAAFVIAQTTDGYDGRSDWRWIRLPNGDLILGVFPQGDTYLQFADTIGI